MTTEEMPAAATAGETCDLSLVVPCYNEASHLVDSVAALLEVLEGTRLSYEVLFVDDRSTDNTRDLIVRICGDAPRCRYVFHEKNRGRGAAFKTGFEQTTGRVCGFIDIDLEVHALFIPWLVNLILRHGWDVATGYRHYVLKQTGATGVLRHVLSRAYRLLCRAALGLDVRDSETGCKFFDRKSAASVVLGSKSDHWFWDTEVMARAELAGLRIIEQPVLFLRRQDKQSTVRLFHDMWAYLKELRRFRREIGMSLSSKSPIYWTRPGYDAVMRALYGQQYRQTYEAVADLIPPKSSVVDVCCGTAKLYTDFLARKDCDYIGLDFNGHFVTSARRRGVDVRIFNLLTERVPQADYIVVCSSLYQFSADGVFEKLLAAARKALIISEPVRNMSQAPLIGTVARALTDPGVGKFDFRYDLSSFQGFAQSRGASRFLHSKGDRNAIAVFDIGNG